MLKIRWKKLLSLIIIDIYIIGLFREIALSDSLNLFSFIFEGIGYSFSHLSFLGLTSGLGMISLLIALLFMILSFIIFNYVQIKNCLEINHRKNK